MGRGGEGGGGRGGKGGQGRLEIEGGHTVITI